MYMGSQALTLTSSYFATLPKVTVKNSVRLQRNVESKVLD